MLTEHPLVEGYCAGTCPQCGHGGVLKSCPIAAKVDPINDDDWEPRIWHSVCADCRAMRQEGRTWWGLAT